MRVQFEYTQADMVDVSKRIMARSRAMRLWHWQGLFATGIIAWLLVFFILMRTPVKGAIIASLAALFAALIYPGLQKRSINKRLHKLQREKFGDTNKFLCEVELTAARIWIRQGDTQISYEWRAVEEIVDTEDAVDIITRDGGGVTVRNRAFQSADERRAFIELAQNFVAQSREVPSSAK